MYNQPDYRKLGGWLTFIFVTAILGIVNCAYSLINAPALLLAGRTRDALGLDYLFPAWYWVVSLISSAVVLALSILTVVFINKRRLGPLKAVFFARWGLAIASYLLAVPLYTTGGGLDFAGFYRNLFTRFGELDGSYERMAPYFDQMAEMMRAVFLFACAFGLLVSVGVTIAWVFYFKRSKRVAVYFDPNYVPPPPPPPQVGGYWGWPGQGYPPQYYGAPYGAPGYYNYPAPGQAPQGTPPQGAPPQQPGAFTPPSTPGNRPES